MQEQINKPPSEKFLRQRKMLLILFPLVAIMSCLLFYGLGGGKGTGKHPRNEDTKGLNMVLPEARFDKKKKALNKLGFYNQADQDSLRMLQSRKQDPYYNREGLPQSALRSDSVGVSVYSGKVLPDTGWRRRLPSAIGVPVAGQPAGLLPVDRQAADLLQKLDQLKGVLKEQTGRRDSMLARGVPGGLPIEGRAADRASFLAGNRDNRFSPAAFNPVAGDVPRDTDLDKLTGLVDKILRIQHPEVSHGSDTMASGREERLAAALTSVPKEELIRTLSEGDGSNNDTSAIKRLVVKGRLPGPGREKDTEEEIPGPGFIELGESEAGMEDANTFEAAILRDQTVVSGQTIGFRLTQEALIKGVRIPEGNLLSGKSTLSGERLLVAITSIRVGKSTIPVSLEVLDLDGMTGIREPGSLNRDVSKESADEAINSLGMTSIDASLGAQAASAGLQAAKTLMSRKIRLVRVGVTAGYKVLLRNTKGNR